MAEARRDRRAPHVHLRRHRAPRARDPGAAAAPRHADRRRPADRAAAAGGASARRERSSRRPRRASRAHAASRSTSFTATSRCSRWKRATRSVPPRASAGVDEREVLVVEPGFKWDAFIGANANASLFGDRKLVDLRIPSGKPGVEGGKALEAYAANPNPDNVTLITLPRVDKATQASAWFAALAEAGVTIAVQPLEREALPRWIAARLARQKQKASPETLAFLADRCEGNLLAARQEIEKLGLVLPEGPLAHDAVEAAVADVARYDVFAASEAWLQRRRGARAARALGARSRGRRSAARALDPRRGPARARGRAGDDARRNADRDRAAQRARLGQAPGGARARGATGDARRRSSACSLRLRRSTRCRRASVAATPGTSSAVLAMDSSPAHPTRPVASDAN